MTSPTGADAIITMADQNKMGSDLSSPIDQTLLAWAEYWYPIAWKGLLAAGIVTAFAACATIAFLLLQWRTSLVREQNSDWRTSVLETQAKKAEADLTAAKAGIAGADARAAEANARAKEAELALVELKIPRWIWWRWFKETLEDVPPATVEVLWVPGCEECFSLATSVRMFLGPEAGLKWTIADFSQIEPRHAFPSLRGLPPAMSVGAARTGITVFEGTDVAGKRSDDSDNSLVTVLVKAIARGLVGRDGPDKPGKWPNPLAVSGNFTTGLPKGLVRVIVAPKL